MEPYKILILLVCVCVYIQRYPVMWQGLLALKNDSAAVQMHFVGGNPGVAADALARNADGTAASLLRIAQRMRLEPAQLDQVHRKMKVRLVMTNEVILLYFLYVILCVCVIKIFTVILIIL